MKEAMALRQRAREEEQAEKQQQSTMDSQKKTEETQVEVAAKQQQEAERLKLEQQQAEAAKRSLEEKRMREEKEAQTAKAIALEAKAQEEKAAAEAAARAEEEKERRATQQAEEEKAKASKIAADKAAREESQRLEREISEKLRIQQQEEEDREFEEEQRKQKQELEARRLAREAEEAKRQQEQQEFMERQKQMEEKQRLMDEKLARQKAEREEAAAKELREKELLQARQREENEQKQREHAERIAAKKAAEEAEIARLREEEEQRRKELIAAQQREEEEHNAEALRLESERAAAAEEARKAEEAISSYENAALEEKKKRAEAQRKKREMFLNDLDSFSTTFEAKNQEEDEKIKAEQDKHYETLAQQMKEVEAVKASVAAKEAKEKEQRATALAAAQLAAEAEAAARAAEVANTPPPVPVKQQSEVEDAPPRAEGNRANIGDLTSTLFASPAVTEVVDAAGTSGHRPQTPDEPDEADEDATPPTCSSDGAAATAAGGSDELRVPTRIGSGKAKKTAPYKPAPASTITAKANAAIAKYSEDEEEEGTGVAGSISNVLTLEERRQMTLAQKDTWRAKQADLTEKRKDFHGVVTYTFDGVFSWQMYGSAEAVDETGSNYTEYLMRCQWGTNFDNMHPWIVAHRYREFDQLDQALKKKFPRLEPNMPKLPKKELFRALSSDVVSERRAILEDYMSKIVGTMPSLLRSELMNDFLDITNRISGIRMTLLKESNKRVAAASAGNSTPDSRSTSASPVPTPAPKSTGSAVPSNSKYGIEDPLSYSVRSPASGPMTTLTTPEARAFAKEEDDEPLYWTLDEAEEARAAKQSTSLDEDALGHLETDIRTLGQLIRKGDNAALVARESKFRTKYRAVSKRWPNLRATAVVGMGVDFTLIPRAMQAEEDLIRYVNVFRNIETAQSLNSPTSRLTAV